MTATRDYRAEYLAARLAVHRAPFLREQGIAEREANKILRAADRAGVDLYAEILDLDNRARLAVAAEVTA